MNDSSPEMPWSVRQVSVKLRDYIARLGSIWIEGQVVQINRRTGMAFGVLRDLEENVALDISVPFAALTGLELSPGMRVVVNGKVEFWSKQGRLSFKVREIRLAGAGQLLARLEELKRKLAAEGLFDQRRKRPLPFAPALIGLIAGRDSHAEHDVVEVATRRWPAARFAIRSATVQGPLAASQVMAALAELDADARVEVIVIARGGGSLEDLLPFSDEALIRAVAAARTPVISAIGHEPDSPILDLVADFRAATPTDAGKRVVPDHTQEGELVAGALGGLRRAMSGLVERESERLAAVLTRPALADPAWIVANRQAEVAALIADGGRGIGGRVERGEADLATWRARLVGLSPQGTLDRGYALVTRQGALVTDPAALSDADLLAVRVARGKFGARVVGLDS
ncbi:MAG: exodeoxyribonuclease VII large subunit [Bifidobacteriaceae bacterium]|jgi:exodeoxyribonuclease VII large subunit|nr:exodeoxyribonuclease VII large subunit [Bifidobacteriaceae bacterium]